MDEEFLSFLCNGSWSYDLSESYVNFNKDNTGKIMGCTGYTMLILSEFEWKCTPIVPLDLSKTMKDDQTPRLIGEFRFDIRVTRKIPEESRKNHETNTKINQGHLKDEAFQPKSFNVRIEDGHFAQPSGASFVGFENEKCWTKRLVFDTSPFGLKSDWKEEFHEYVFWMNPDGNNFWDHKEFVAYNQS